MEINQRIHTTGDSMEETMGQRKGVNNDVIETENNDDKDDMRMSEAKISTEQSQYDNPVDHGWAWVVLIGCFGISMFIIGGLKSFGVLYVEMAKKFQVSNQALSSIQSLAGFFYLFFAPVCNALSTRFTHRLVIFIGGIMTSSGLILSSMAPSVVVLYFTYGVVTGIGYSFCFSSSVVMVANYFMKYRSFATGLSLSGGGLGAMTIPYLIRYVMNKYGLEGALLIHAGVMSNVCVCAMLLRPFTNYPLKRQPQQDTCVNEDQEKKSFINKSQSRDECKSINRENAATIIISDNTLDCESSVDMLPYDHSDTPRLKYLHPEDHTGSGLHLSNDSINVIAASISCQSLPRIFEASSNSHVRDISAKKKTFLREIKWELFLNPIFTVFFVMVFFSMVSYHSLFNVVPPFADEIGLSGEDGALVLLVFGATDLIGRIGFGILMDIFSTPKQRHIIFTTCVSVCAVGVILTPIFRSLLTLSLFMASYGCFAGGYNATAMIIVVDKVGMKFLPSAWGFICLSASIAMLINPWASGLIKDSTGTWAHAFRFSGSMSLMAVILLLLMPYIERLHSTDKGLPSKKSVTEM